VPAPPPLPGFSGTDLDSPGMTGDREMERGSQGGEMAREHPLLNGPMTRLLFCLLRHHLPPLRGPESTVKDLWYLLRQERYGDALLVAMRHDRDWIDPGPGTEERERVYEQMVEALHERPPTPDGR